MEAYKIDRISNYIGTFVLSELVNIKVTSNITYLIINMNMSCSVAVAIYPTTIYICDPTGLLSAGLPPQMTEFLWDMFTDSHVYITNQLSSVFCINYLFLFIYTMSNSHSYSLFLSYFSDNFDLNDHITNYLYHNL